MPTRRPARPDAGAQRVPAVVTRPTRTGVQGGAAYLVLEALVAFDIADLNGRQWAVSMLILTAVFSFAQTLAENRLGAGFLRAVPPKDEPVDVPGEAGHLTVLDAVVVVALVIVCLFVASVIEPGMWR